MVDPRYYFLDMQALVDSGLLQDIPPSSSKDNSPTGTGAYTFYVDHEGKVQTLYFYFPVIQGFVDDVQGEGEPVPTPIVPSDTAPSVSITGPANGSTFLTTDSIPFNGSGIDAQDGPLSGGSLVWTSSQTGQIGPGESFNALLVAGVHTITLTATDKQGGTGSASVDITVNTPIPFNSRPTAAIISPASGSNFLTTTSILFKGTGIDAEDGPLSGASLVWDSSLDGDIGDGTSVNAFLTAGNHLITLRVTDSQGSTGRASVSITVNTPPSSAVRVRKGLVVLYDFEEIDGDTVNDVSGVGTPLNLTIQDLSRTSRSDGALSVNRSTIIQSGVPATKVIDALQFTNEITIEAWVKSADDKQKGPAGIVTLSASTSVRNFTLGQEKKSYDIRLRTASTSLNGTPSLSTRKDALTTALTHVVYTRSHPSGDTKVYIDGSVVATGNAPSSFNGWDDSFPLALANELTLNRAWLGELHLVAIFDRALTQSEANQNFDAGPDGVTLPPNPTSLAGSPGR